MNVLDALPSVGIQPEKHYLLHFARLERMPNFALCERKYQEIQLELAASVDNGMDQAGEAESSGNLAGSRLLPLLSRVAISAAFHHRCKLKSRQTMGSSLSYTSISCLKRSRKCTWSPSPCDLTRLFSSLALLNSLRWFFFR